MLAGAWKFDWMMERPSQLLHQKQFLRNDVKPHVRRPIHLSTLGICLRWDAS